MTKPDLLKEVREYELIETLFEDCLATGHGTEASNFAENWGYCGSDSAGYVAKQNEAINGFMRDCNDGIPRGEEMTVAQHVDFYRNEYLSSQAEAEEVPVHIWDVIEDADVLDQRAVIAAMKKVKGAAPGDTLEVARQALSQLIAERS